MPDDLGADAARGRRAVPGGLAYPGGSGTRILGVVANWNRRGALLRCLDRIVGRVRVPAGCTLDLLVVDNDSHDGSREAVAARFSRVAVLNTGKNLGGSGAFRAGLVRAVEDGYDLAWLVDNDVYVSSRILERYLAAWHRLGPRVVLGGTMHVAEDPRVIHEAGALFREDAAAPILLAGADDLLRWGRHVRIQLIQHGRRSTAARRRGRRCADVDYLAFANLLVPVPLVRAIGLPSDLFLHYDDVEFCLRARGAGYRIVNVPDAVYWHESGQAKPPTWVHYYDARNLLYAVERARPDALEARRRRLLYTAAKHLMAGRSAVARLVLRGVRDHSRSRTGGIRVPQDGFSVYDVRRTDPRALLAAYRCRHLVLDWDSLDDLLPPYRRAWWDFLARCAGQAYLALDDRAGGTELYRLPPLPWSGGDGGPGSPPTALGERLSRSLLREALYARSPHRTGVRTRLRFRECPGRAGVHGPALIDADRLSPAAKAATALEWAWTWMAARRRAEPGRWTGAAAGGAITWEPATTVPAHPTSST